MLDPQLSPLQDSGELIPNPNMTISIYKHTITLRPSNPQSSPMQDSGELFACGGSTQEGEEEEEEQEEEPEAAAGARVRPAEGWLWLVVGGSRRQRAPRLRERARAWLEGAWLEVAAGSREETAAALGRSAHMQESRETWGQQAAAWR